MAFDYKQEYNRYKRYYQAIEPVLQKPLHRAYTAIIFSFLVVSLFSWYAIRPTMQTIFTLKREIADKTEIDKKMEDKISALIEAQAVYQDVEQDIPLLNQALPVTSDAVRAAAQLQTLAQNTRVIINNLSVSSVPVTDATKTDAKKTTPNTVTSVPVALTVTGGYLDIKNFIQGILDTRRIMEIDSMTFAPKHESATTASASATPTGTQVQVDLKLKVFYFSSAT